MTDNDMLIEMAKLDDVMYEWCESLGVNAYFCKYHGEKGIWYPRQQDIPYLTSRDAIIPVIEKQDWETLGLICDLAVQQVNSTTHGFGVRNIFKATPRQLCIALLKATGKWKN